MLQNKAVARKGYSMRLPEDIRTELERLAQERAESTGKKVKLIDIILEGLEYGMPVVARENLHHIAIPSTIKTKTETLAFAASEMVRRGIELSFPQI